MCGIVGHIGKKKTKEILLLSSFQRLWDLVERYLQSKFYFSKSNQFHNLNVSGITEHTEILDQLLLKPNNRYGAVIKQEEEIL